MTQCGFVHFKDPWEDDPEDQHWACQEEATHTCCDYGGKVCIKHKCRCSKPLPSPKVKNILAAVMQQKAGAS
jgi:hypothetical protein